MAFKYPIMADGYVPSWLKILDYRGKMPLPQIIMDPNMINDPVYEYEWE